MRRVLGTLTASALLAVCLVPGLPAGAILAGKVFDGEGSSKAVHDAMRQGQQFSPSLKTPLGGKDLTIALLGASGGSSGGANGASGGSQSWKVTTDASGSFSLDTGLEKWPEKATLVAFADLDGRRLYSPFLRAAAESQDVHLYPSTESPVRITADMKVAYDILSSGEAKSLRVRVGLRLVNQGGALYVGQKVDSPWREVWRIPFPAGAVITANTGPHPGVGGWKLASDGRSLVLDVPIAGICDFELARQAWEVQYVVPARQALVQSYPVTLSIDPQAFTVWCSHEDMTLTSPQLKNKDSRILPDPFTGEERHQEVLYSNEPLKAGSSVVAILGADNVAIGQMVSLGALKWVGGFVIVVVLSILCGLVLGPKGPAPEALLEGLSGDEVLDRIAQLDQRFARGEVRDRDYQRLREPLVELAAEEAAVSNAASTPSAPDGRGSAHLPQGVRRILQRIDEIEKSGGMDPALIAERAHLLEALAKALPREAERG